MTNVALIILPHDNYDAFTSNDVINQAFTKSYRSLCNLVIPQHIHLSVSLVCHKSSQDFFSDFVKLLQTNKTEIQFNTLILEDQQSMLSECLSVSLQQTQADYVMFFVPGSELQSDFLTVVQPELKSHPLIIKSAVVHPDQYMLLDEQYGNLLNRSPIFLCKDFGSLIIQREFLLHNNFIQNMHRFCISDTGLCATLSEMLQTKAKKEQLEAIQAPVHHQVTLFEANKTSLQKLEHASDSLLTAAKNHPPLIYLPAAKIALPLPNYSAPEQIKSAAQELLATYQTMEHMAVSYISFTLICFLDKVMYCANSQLKLLTVQECLYIYQTFRQHAKNTHQDEKVIEYLHKMMNELCKKPISAAFEQQDTVALLEVGFHRLISSTQKKLKECAFDHASLSFIESKFKELLRISCGLPKNFNIPDDQYAVFESSSLIPVNSGRTASHVNFVSSVPPVSTTTQTPETALAPHADENTAYPKPSSLQNTIDSTQNNSLHHSTDPIYVVSAVNDPTLYKQLFLQNPMLNEPNVYLCPRLNPNPQQPDKVLGLSYLYNQFIDEITNSMQDMDKQDCSKQGLFKQGEAKQDGVKHELYKQDRAKQGWIVFCHNDFEIIEQLTPVLSKLDKNYIYGPCGAFISQKKGHNVQAFVGYSIEKSPRKDLLNYTFKNSNFHRFPQDREKYVVDTLDCLCMIVHSSLVQQFNLRFDEHLRFDLVVEDFCINAKLNYHIPTKLVNLASIHHSNATVWSLPPSYFASLKYLNQKYPQAVMAGTCSLIGGGVEPQDYFL